MEELFFQNKADWRKWLSLNYQSKEAVWLLFYKSNSGISCMTYYDSVEQALCYGWIDGLVKSIDHQMFKRKFMPRVNFDQWSETNRKRVEKLLDTGEMLDIGLNKIGDYKETRELRWSENRSSQFNEFSSDLLVLLTSNTTANLFFQTLSSSYKKRYISWVMSAKREETRNKRMNEAIRLLQNETKNLLK